MGHIRMSDNDSYKVQSPRFTLEYEPDSRVLWGIFSYTSSASFTTSLLAEIRSHERSLQVDSSGCLTVEDGCPVDYYVWSSQTPGIFSLGGDLEFFVKCIRSKDRNLLLSYALQCIEVLYLRLCNYHSTNLITVSLVQGSALGGGLEAALASDVIIAEEQTRLGFPEIDFNLFPGMGAYSVLFRRVGHQLAKKMIVSGDLYSASACFDMGVIDVVAPQGGGRKELQGYIKKHQKSRNGLAAIFNARRRTVPITREELVVITTQWVDTALKLEDRDLRLMMKLVQSQHRKLARV